MFTPPSSPFPFYTIVLLRHGESVGNVEGFHQGQVDFALTHRGVAQVKALLRRWKHEGVTFDRIIASPLKRASQTAELIAQAMRIPLQLDPDWMERDVGLLGGLRPEEAAEVAPRPPFMHPYQAVGETGESQWELYLRAGRAVQNLLKNPSGRYLVVSHGGILNLAFYAILGIAPQANFTGPRFRFANTAFATLTYRPDEHKWAVLGVNDHAHWKKDRS
jgi:2,3-bisphosphoglycerate-dependent phosphoglycerate mutase